MKLHLVTQLYRPSDPAVFRRILECVAHNVQQPFVQHLTLLSEGSTGVRFNTDKITVVDGDKRSTFADLLRAGVQNQPAEASHLAIANSDIFFSSQFGVLLGRLNKPTSVAALTRRELNGQLYPNPKVSQDAWVFKAHRFSEQVLRAVEFLLGIAGCEHLFAMALQCHGYEIWNPCLDCEIKHNDPAPRMVYPDRMSGFYLFLPPCHIHDVEASAPGYEVFQSKAPFQVGQEHKDDVNEAVMARWPGPLVPASGYPTMPSNVTGRVMNLDSATERWQKIHAQLQQLGWSSTHQRFSAQRASKEEAESMGLPSVGYLGLWRTTKAVLQDWLNSGPSDDAILHVIEDDAIFHSALPLVVPPLVNNREQLDVLFTEVFLTLPFFRRFHKIEQQRQRDNAGLVLLKGSQYLACASSFLLTFNGARKLLAAMQQVESVSGKVPMNDIYYRHLIRSGQLRAAITLPFFSTIQQTDDSAVQTGMHEHLARSKQVDLVLRRYLFAQTWYPEQSESLVQELAKQASSGLGSEQLVPLIDSVISHGLANRWLVNY